MNGNQRLAMRRLGRRTMTWKAAWLVLAAWLASASGILCPVAGAQSVAGTVGVGGYPIAMQLNPVTNKIYVANYGGSNVTVIDGATSTAIATVPAGDNPCVVAVNPVTNKIYIGNFGAASVTVIDGATDTVITTVTTEVDPGAIAVNPVTNKIYVVSLAGIVNVIDGVTDTAVATISLGSGLSQQGGVAVNPLTNKIYVASSATAEVTVIDGATDTAIATVAVGTNPQAVAVNPVTNRIYVVNNGSNNVTVIDGTTNTAIATVAVGTNAQAVAVNPVTNRIYVANTGSNNVTVIDGTINATATIATGNNPVMMAINPLTNKIYVAFSGNAFLAISSSSVTVIDGATNTASTITGVLNSSFSPLESNLAVNPVTNKIYVGDSVGGFTAKVTVIDGGGFPATLVSVGANPQSIAANPNTNKIYVPNQDSNNLTMIDGATNATTTLATGTQPVAVAVNPVAGKIYVANSGSNNVTVIDGTTNATATVAAGTQPVGAAVNPVTNKIYVANSGSNNVTVIDGITNVTTTVPAGMQPVAVAVNPVTNKIYIANSGSNNVTVIDGAMNTTATVAAGSQPLGVAVNPVTNKIYIINSGDNSVTVIDGATNTTTTVATGTLDSPVAVAVNPITNKIYCVNQFNTVTVIDGATNATTTVVIVGTQPTGVVVNQTTNRIYVANSDNVSVIDGATNTVLVPVPVEISVSANGVTVNPVTNSIYITNGGGTVGNVFVVQNQQPLALQAVIAPLPGNITGNLTPTFDLSKTGDFPPFTPSLRGMYMQIDTWQGPWIPAASQDNGQFTATVATPLQPGIHIVYAYADLEDIVFANQQSQTPLMSTITGYAFVVAPPSAGLSPTSLDFGSQPVNTTSLAQTVTLTNANSPLDIGGISVSGHFLESDDCPAQLAAGASCTISVMFAPVSGDQGNTVTGAVTITDDNHGITGNTDTIALTGVGSAPVTAPPTITKSFNASLLPIGGLSTLTFTIQNPNATVALTGVAFTDSLPGGLILANPPNASSTCGGTTTAVAGATSVSLSGGTLATSASCTVSVDITSNAAGVKNNSVQVTSTEGGTGNTSTATITVTSPPVIIKAFGAASIPLGGSTSLTFTIQNNNTSTTLTGVAFSDTLPSGLVVSTPNGLSGSCGGGTITATQATNVISLTGASLAQSTSCSFAVNVTGTAAGTQNNTTGNVNSNEGGMGGTASASVVVVDPPTIANAFGAASIALNATTSLTFTITNPAANAVSLTGVAFTDTLPTGLTVANATAALCGGTLTTTAPTGIALAGATIAANAQCQLSITVTGAASGDYTNTTAAVTSTNGGTGNTATANLSVASPPTITKTFGAATIPLNGTTSLSFTITNPVVNALPLTGVTFTDMLPAGLIVATPNGLTGSCGGGTIAATAGSGSVSLTGATLGTSASCTFSMNVTGTSAGPKTNSVQVTSTEGGPGNTSNANITVVGPPVIIKAFGAGSIPLNGSTSLQFTIQNNNALTTLTGVGFSDALPVGLVVATPDGLTGSCGGGTITATTSTGVISLSGASLASSTSCTFAVNVTGMTAGAKNNTTGNVNSNEGGAGGTSSASVAVVAPPTIANAFGMASVALNGTTSLTLTISNPAANSVAETGIAFTDNLPTGLVVATPSGLSNSCGGPATAASASSSVTLTAGSIATPGNTCTVVVNVTGTTSGVKNNTTGAVSSTNAGTGATSNTASLAVASPPTVAKAFGALTIPLNGSTTLTFSITNPNVNLSLTGVAFTDTLPSGLVVASTPNLISTCGTATAVGGSGSVSLPAGTLAISASCAVSVDVTGTTVGVKNNSVQVTSIEGGTGNTSNATITVVGPPVISKAFGVASIPLNNSTSLTFAIQNNNVGTTLTGVGFTDTLPAGLIISTPNGLTGSCGGGAITATQATNVISLTGASIAASTSCTFSVNVTGSTGGVKNNTTGNVTSTEGGMGGTASASVTVLMPDVTITKTHAGSFTQGQTIGATYTITVSNIGTAPTVGAVSVTDALPAGLTATAIGGTGWTCPTLINCTRSDVLANGSSYPAITLTVSVALNAPDTVINSVTVSGGGETDLTNDTAADTTAVTPLSGPPLTIVPLNNSTDVSIPAGSSAAFGFTVTSSSALLGGINFTCSGLPSGTACSFDNQGETQPQTQVTMTITTTARARAKTSVPEMMNSGGTAPLYAALLLPFFNLVQLGLRQLRGRGRKSKNFRPRVAMLLGGCVLLLALAGCGGHAGQHGTPTGTYPISVTATSSTTPSVQALTVVNLTVQ